MEGILFGNCMVAFRHDFNVHMSYISINKYHNITGHCWKSRVITLHFNPLHILIIPSNSLVRHTRHPLRPIRPLVVIDRTSRLCAVGKVCGCRAGRNRIPLLRPSIRVLIIPNLTERGVSSIRTIYRASSSRVIVSGTVAPDKWNAAVVFEENVADGGVRVSSLIRRRNIRVLKPLERGESFVVFYRRLKEINHIFVLAVLRTVTRHIKSRETGSVFAEFVTPEARVVLQPCDPVVVHILEEIVATKGFEEGANVGVVVGRDECAIWQAVCGVGGGDGVVLPV